MKQIEFNVRESIDEAYQKLQKNNPCYGLFNGIIIRSDDSLDDIYLKVTGKTKIGYDEELHKQHDEYKRKESDFKARIPKLTKEYRERARGIIPLEHLEFWDKIVPIRLDDLYRGMELDCWLELINILNDKCKTEDNKMNECLNMFIKQGHSGMSAGIVFSGLKKFHPLGDKLVKFIKEN